MSIESLLEQVNRDARDIAQFETTISGLKNHQSQLLVQLRELTGPSFTHGGKHYQIRSRGETTYIVSSDRPLGRPRRTT